MKVFTQKEAGCMADDALGHQHIRDNLASLVVLVDGPQDLLASLRSPEWPDDLSDEDEALALLDENTESGLFWEIDSGLFLREDGEGFDEWEIPDHDDFEV